jgi:hypothetical protein
MKYRDAKHLKSGDQVRLKDGSKLIVLNTEILGSLKVVRINCVSINEDQVVVYNNDIDEYHIF